MILCEWCEQPTTENNLLCDKCLHAQRQVEAKNLLNASELSTRVQPNKPISLPRQIMVSMFKATMFVVTGLAIIFLGLAGTCFTIITAISLFYNPPGIIFGVIGVLISFGLLSLLIKYFNGIYSEPPPLVKTLYKTPIQPVEPNAALLENSDLSEDKQADESSGSRRLLDDSMTDDDASELQ